MTTFEILKTPGCPNCAKCLKLVEKIRKDFPKLKVGDIGHNLIVEGYNVGTRAISGGASETIEFIAEKTGTFTFYCPVPSHRAAGMERQLVVI